VICSPLFIFAQISEDFSDGDFMYNPEWFGDINRFIINENGRLQLKAIEAGSAVLYTKNACSVNCEWQFYIRLSFSPSANNNARVYLAADNADLRGDLNGYFLQFGEAGSGDAIELFRQNGQNLTSICRGTESKIATSFEMRIKVQHLHNGNWNIYSDLLKGEGFVLETSGFDSKTITSNYFGILCTYTNSNSEKFYFDDILIVSLNDPAPIDSIPPQILNFNCNTNTELELTFSEHISEESGFNTFNYLVNNEAGNPETIELSENNTKTTLHFTHPFENGKMHTLSIKNISDTSYNQMKDTILNFLFFEASALDIVINEILDDPAPSVELPEFEYIELFNTTAFEIDLNGWMLQINDKTQKFENCILPPHGYLILCNHSAKGVLSDFGPVYSFSSFLLPNAGSKLSLINHKGLFICSFNYNKTDFKNDEKENGGWSIEQKDYSSTCLGVDNWAYSSNTLGGSPGGQNSISENYKPKPEIISFEVINDTTLQLIFANTMDTESIENPLNFKIIESGKTPVRSKIEDLNHKLIVLIFSERFSKNNFYTLEISSRLQNCLGLNLANDHFFTFGIPDEIEINDIVINEILYQHLNNGEEYIEIYNRSEKILNIADLEICLIKEKSFPQPADTTCKGVLDHSRLINPSTYLVLTRSPEKVLEQYDTPNPENFITVAEMPRLVNDGGTIGIINQKGVYLDRVAYDEEMHSPMLNYTEGVSLEKIHFNLSGLEKSNWHSASFAVGFGTPAYQNSQFLSLENAETPITVSPHVFTPDNDGRDDLLKIEYQLEKAGYTANVIIFSAEGIKVKQLVNNELLGTQGAFFWNGTDENSEKMPRGIYIVFVELFDLNGNIKHYKQTAVLGERF